MDYIENESEEIYQRLIKKKSVLGVMVSNENGIRTSMDNATTSEMANAIVPLNNLARKTVKNLDPENDLLFFRIRTNKNEMMIGVGMQLDPWPGQLIKDFAYNYNSPLFRKHSLVNSINKYDEGHLYFVIQDSRFIRTQK